MRGMQVLGKIWINVSPMQPELLVKPKNRKFSEDKTKKRHRVSKTKKREK